MKEKEQNRSAAARAYDAIKDKDDPVFEATTAQYQGELNARAADVVKTGITVNAFEEEVAKINAQDIKDTPPSVLGTTEVRFDAASDAKASAKSETKAAATAKAEKEEADKADAAAKAAKTKADAQAKADADAKAKADKAKADEGFKPFK